MLRTMRLTLVIVGMMATQMVGGTAQAGSPEKQAQIRELLENSGGLAVAEQMMQLVSAQTIELLSQQSGQRPSPGAVEAIQKATSKVMRRNFGLYLDDLVSVYDKTYTDSEIAEMLAFYKSPTGRKAVQTLPQVMQASQVIAQRWMQKIAPELNSEIKAALTKLPGQRGG